MNKNRPLGRAVIPEWASCKNCKEFDGEDYCRYHFIMCGKEDNKHCPDWENVSGEDISETYIGRTKEYYEDGDWVFTPALWKWVSNPESLAGEVHALTKEGEELLNQWCEDAAAGYDLCNGRAEGLAAKYSSEQIWEVITNPKNGYSAKVIAQKKFGRIDMFERVEEYPFGYCVWNIGRSNFPYYRCIPIAKPMPTEYDWQMCIDTSCLKYIEVESETLALQILKEASRNEVDRNRFLEIVNQ